ncbi:proteasome-interacting protein cic1 [Maublancomyces gigas]|uniref:Proteasome-interacting protein cic1 n=1 Tax=Discina gigas TaxID=1032678 RepID=A0ABR3GC34_9PEZI
MATAIVTEPGKAAAQVPSNSPYQLDKAQVLKASRALLKFVVGQEKTGAKPNLLADADEPDNSAETIWLNLATKKFISDVKRLKPSQVALPHPLRTATSSTICLIVKDPQRTFKDLVVSASLSATITKVISISKLRAKFRTFESRRALCASHDIFLADSRIVRMLPALLGKPFYSRTVKTPIPVNFEGPKAVTPARLAAETRAAIGSTYVHLSASASTSVRVGRADFTPEQIVENVDAVVTALVAKKVPAGWRGVRSFHIKSPNSAALPIWMTQELYADEDVLRPADEERKALVDAARKEKRTAKKMVKRAQRAEFVKSRAALNVQKEEEQPVEMDFEPAPVSKALVQSEERLVEREVVAKKKRRALGDVVDAGLDVTVKEAKKLKTKKAM